MISRIQIENYKSFGKVDIEPHPSVNLLIGPNSSGKSNFLEALQFGKVKDRILENPQSFFDSYKSSIRRKNGVDGFSIELFVNDLREKQDSSLGLNVNASACNFSLNTQRDNQFGSGKYLHIVGMPAFVVELTKDDQRDAHSVDLHFSEFKLNHVASYQAAVNSMRREILSSKFETLDPDLGNVALLIHNLDQYHREGLFKDFLTLLKELTNEFDRVAAPPSSSPGHIELCFFSNGVAYSPQEVSDGILLFTALLAILHLPEPPQVILLEEPENGIHPRRLAEIVSLIRRLAEEKEVQFFITTHSPIILDQFQDAPECVLVFDKVDGVSKVRNLSAILEEKAAIEKANGLPITDYTKGLSDNWLWGYLDGVPPITI
jgi:predicted ATPase